jgi:hypothetical protein
MRGWAAVQEKACPVLSNIIAGADAQADARKQAAADAGALGAVVAAMRAHAGVAAVQEWACRALTNLTWAGGRAKQMALDAGALHAVEQARQRFPEMEYTSWAEGRLHM